MIDLPDYLGEWTPMDWDRFYRELTEQVNANTKVLEELFLEVLSHKTVSRQCKDD